ncbi:MAG: LuxR C-terminal-related transcriptional regulator, partial [Aquificaceae bacterium]|nr:LuxR C-terminal-related transcriptional regulator [Aquificaceae bacterium]
YSLVRLRNPLTAFPVGFGVICLAILTGYFVFKNMGNTKYVIALGNLLLVSIAVYLVYTKKSRSEETPMSQEASQVEITEQSETEYAQKTPENFLKELCESRAPYKKELSKREKGVLVLLLKGLIYHDISQALGISVSAVREYARRALEKLGLRKEELLNMYEEWKKNKDSMME